jgi:hypothetical protein
LATQVAGGAQIFDVVKPVRSKLQLSTAERSIVHRLSPTAQAGIVQVAVAALQRAAEAHFAPIACH